jgi:hypothetical protein
MKIKGLLWKLILILAIPSIWYCGYETFTIVKDKDITLAWLTNIMYLLYLITVVKELMKND